MNHANSGVIPSPQIQKGVAKLNSSIQSKKQMTPAKRTQMHMQIDKTLPEDCFFLDEKREDLPSDPVELCKIKLIKENAISNLKRHIRKLRSQASANNTEKDIQDFNRQIDVLDSKIADLDQRIAKLKELKKQDPKDGRPDQRPRISIIWSILIFIPGRCR